MSKKIYLIIFLVLASNHFAIAEDDFLNSKEVLKSVESKIRNPFQGFLPVAEIKEKVPSTGGTSSNRIRPVNNAVHEEPVALPPAMNITGLVWNTKRPQAIINGQVMDVGDSIESAKIVAIKKTGIDILFDNKTITVQQ